MEDRASRRTVAVTAVVLVAVAALLVVSLTGGALRDAAPDRARADAPEARMPRDVTPSAALASLAVLRDWDRRRAAAWRAGDALGLGALYAPGSAAGEHDVAMLERWVRRGLRVRGMAMQVLAVELLVRTDRRIVLEVTDRLAGPVAVGRGRRWSLPRDGVSVRRLEFRRPDGRWLLASVQAASRPEATTSATVGSANS